MDIKERFKKELGDLFPKRFSLKEDIAACPGKIKEHILFTAAKGILPFAAVCLLFMAMLGGEGEKMVFLIGFILSVAAFIAMSAARMAMAGSDIKEWKGKIYAWKKGDTLSAWVGAIADSPSTGIRRLRSKDKDTFKQAGVSYYQILVEEESEIFLVPIQKTNTPYEIGTKVTVWASSAYQKNKETSVFKNVYMVELDKSEAMPKAGEED